MGSKRITDKDLRELCERLNTITDSPLTAYSKDDDGKFHPNVGHYYIEGAYGGVGLRQITTRSTCETPLGGGYCTKRELFDRIHAYMRGMAVGYSMVEK